MPPARPRRCNQPLAPQRRSLSLEAAPACPPSAATGAAPLSTGLAAYLQRTLNSAAMISQTSSETESRSLRVSFSTPTGRLAAMESRVKVMLQAVQTVRPPLERFYQLLRDEQKARLNAVSPGGKSNADEDQRALTNFCRERAPGVTDLPFDRIAQATQPTSAQRSVRWTN